MFLAISLCLLFIAGEEVSWGLDLGGAALSTRYYQQTIKPLDPPFERSLLNTRLDLWQRLTPHGQFDLSLDFNRSDDGSGLGRWFAGWRGLLLGSLRFDLSGGDHLMTMTRLDTAFSHQIRQPLSFRGGLLTVTEGRTEWKLFGGHLADPGGILSSEPIVYDESVYGTAIRLTPMTPRLILGATYLQLRHQGPRVLTPFPQSRVFLAEADLLLAENLHLLMEHGLAEAETPHGSLSGSLLRIGPLYRHPSFYFETLYRRIEPAFFLPIRALESDQEGVFTAFSLHPLSPISFHGSGDVFRDNLEEDPLRPTLLTFQWQVGTQWLFPPLPAVSLLYAEKDASRIGGAAAPERSAVRYRIEFSQDPFGISIRGAYQKEREIERTASETLRQRAELFLSVPCLRQLPFVVQRGSLPEQFFSNLRIGGARTALLGRIAPRSPIEGDPLVRGDGGEKRKGSTLDRSGTGGGRARHPLPSSLAG